MYAESVISTVWSESDNEADEMATPSNEKTSRLDLEPSQSV